MTAGPAASRRVGINGRTSPPPDSSLPEVCSFQLPKVCSFRLPLTAGDEDCRAAVSMTGSEADPDVGDRDRAWSAS